MSIMIKKGDTGLTGLYMGPRVAKDSFRIELNGALDELSSFLSMSISCIRQKKFKRVLLDIRADLFVIGTEMATAARFVPRLKKRINLKHVAMLEEKIMELEKKEKTKARCFTVTDEGLLSSVLNVARAVARKAERRAVTLVRKKS